MTTAEIKSWLIYWKNARMVAVDEIRAFDQVYQARRFCSCIREGLFRPDHVTDLQIWNAIRDLRKAEAA